MQTNYGNTTHLILHTKSYQNIKLQMHLDKNKTQHEVHDHC